MIWWLLACVEPEPIEPSDSEADSAASDLVFAGIRSLAWDGADGLTARWDEAIGEGSVAYEVVLSRADQELGRAPAGGVDHRFVGLTDGEYQVSVEAVDGLGRRVGGDVRLHQLVGENRLVYRSEVPLPRAADVWGQGDIVVLAGRASGVSFVVVDSADVEAPSVLHVRYDAGFVKDSKIGDGLLFTNGECGCKADTPEWEAYDKVGARVWDFADPAEPVLLAEIGEPSTSVHNLSYGDGMLYLADNTTRGIHAWDVTDPEHPSLAWDWMPPGGMVHDLAWVDGKLYIAWWAGFAILDVSDPLDPQQELLYVRDGPAAIHNAWPTQDGLHVLTTDERVGGDLRIYDISDRADVVEVASFQTDPEHSIHNVHVRGSYAYLSYYLDGVFVLDISTPAEPVVVGSYDSFDEDGAPGPEPQQVFDGAWGVWPFGDHVAVGDMRRGLILLDHVPDVVTVE